MPKRAHERRGGFTLVEALAAGIVLGLGATVLGTAVARGLRSMQLSLDCQRAAELLDRTLVKIDLIGPDRLLAEGPLQGEFSPPDDRFSWEATIDARVDGHLYEVTVRVSWHTVTGRRTVDAQTLLNDPPRSRSPTLTWDDL